MRTNVLLGELLLERKLITREQLSQALTEQKATKEPLGQILIRNHALEETQLRMVLSEQLGVSFLAPEQLKPRVDQRLKEYIPEDFAREHKILPLAREGRVLKLAVTRMPDIIFLDNIRKMTGFDISPVLSTTSELSKAIEIFYGSTDMQELVSSEELDKAKHEYIIEKDDAKVDLEASIAEAEKAPVIRLVDAMLKKALDDRASDIHIEPFRDRITLRYRIDGILYELPSPPREMHNAMVSRIKILGKMDIAEKRIPQDGSFSLNYKERRIDVRVSTIPIVSGEKIVMRILDKRTDLLDMKLLGFEPEQQAFFETALMRPYGLIFVTGPTGSGKSTTLYAALNKRMSSEVNIITIEDPVEYQITGLNQVQVKPDIGLTFASGLRAFLRQDPDVILVGEVRDLETAEICIRASLTGHLVLSTLHTNDAVTAVTRLIDIGIQPYLVSGSLALVAAQRLIRLVCPHCKVPQRVDAKLKEQYDLKADTIYNAKGCAQCRNIGYWGRAAIYETLPIDEDFRRLISKDADLDALRRLQKQKNYGTLFQNGLKKVEQGVSTLEEVLSVAYE
ncbi:MAG: Flp pilus assembly complex ATPase component TadA [Candidatus Omnitrophica bacterium]|nr:Flp pilus assembly complex ATPase component TadA [Candidatus Omnitrophota bacterium]